MHKNKDNGNGIILQKKNHTDTERMFSVGGESQEFWRGGFADRFRRELL